MNKVKKSIKEGKLTVGSWVSIGHPRVAEIIAQAGFDWLTLDTEHGANDIEIGERFLQGIQGTSCVPFIRLPENNSIWIRRSLDAGFVGIIVPMVNTRADAERAVEACKYPPVGKRGIGFSRANQYGFGLKEYVDNFNEEVVLICQIEHKDAVKNIDEILSVKGVDGAFMGPYDLSGSMGILGQFDHPDMRAAMKKVLEAAKNAGVVAGIHVVPPSVEDVYERYKEGFRFIALSLDITVLGHHFRKMFKELTPIIGKS